MTLDLRIFTEPQEGASYEQLLAVARTAEELGFDAFFRSDHYIKFFQHSSGLPGPTDAWTSLAGLARDTSTIRLGTLVSPVTFRLPGPLAIVVAQVDAMSSGRVELGLGAGWHDGEHAAYGIPFPPTAERFEMLEEQLAVVTGLWATAVGDSFSFDGKHYSLKDSPALPKPVQQPGPPIILGGWGARRTPRLAAQFAAEFNVPFAPLDAFNGRVADVRAACERAGRDPATLIMSAALVVCCASDEAELQRRAKAIGHDVDELRKNAAAGTPAEVVERLQQFASAGAHRAYLQILDLDDLDHMRLIGTEVLPHV
jgi:F420-dependent oxidoreductase-like protein